MPTCPPQPSIVKEARNLGSNLEIITSYKLVQGTPLVVKSQDWFFTKNSGLVGASPRPGAEPATWNDWRGLTFQQRIVLGDLGGFDADTVVANASNLAKVKAGYARWPAGLYATFWAGRADVNTCNIYVGESLFADGKSLAIDNKYASAEAIFNANDWSSPLRRKLQRIDVGDVQPGDIAAWEYPSDDHHVEIVSSVNMGAGTFCSIGGYRADMGKEKCAGTDRQLALASGEVSPLRFYRWCPQEEEAGGEKGGCRLGCNPWTWWV